MNWWPRSREQRRQDAAATYAEALAVWQIENNTDRHDFTPEQRERYRLFVRAINAGVDLRTVVLWRYRVRTGQVES